AGRGRGGGAGRARRRRRARGSVRDGTASLGPLADGDCLDFDSGTGWKGGDLDGGPRGSRRGEVAPVDLVHEAPFLEVDYINGGFDDIGEGGAGGGEDGREVLDGAGGPGRGAGLDQPAGGGIEADLAGAEYQVAADDGLAVRADRARSPSGHDRGAAHSRTRSTRITPRTRSRFRMTRFSSSTLPTISSNEFCALWSPMEWTRAPAMLMPAALIAFDIAASRPGRSTQVTSTRTGRGVPFPSSHWTSIRRCGSVSSTFAQSCACTVTPRPRVMKPAMASPGSGLQHLPNRTRTSSTPDTRTPLVVCRLTRRKRRWSAPAPFSRRRRSSSGGRMRASTWWLATFP